MAIDQQLVNTPQCMEEDWITDDQHAAAAWWDSQWEQSEEIPTCDDIPF